jgi:hypothetical protein
MSRHSKVARPGMLPRVHICSSHFSYDRAEYLFSAESNAAARPNVWPLLARAETPRNDRPGLN